MSFLCNAGRDSSAVHAAVQTLGFRYESAHGKDCGKVSPIVAPMAGMGAVAAGTMMVSAALIFSVQPLLGRLILPYFGGVPAVWNTAMLFFQAALLLGYGYAHLLARHISPTTGPRSRRALTAVDAVPAGRPSSWMVPAGRTGPSARHHSRSLGRDRNPLRRRQRNGPAIAKLVCALTGGSGFRSLFPIRSQQYRQPSRPDFISAPY